jgi:hypothetical protein
MAPLQRFKSYLQGHRGLTVAAVLIFGFVLPIMFVAAVGGLAGGIMGALGREASQLAAIGKNIVSVPSDVIDALDQSGQGRAIRAALDCNNQPLSQRQPGKTCLNGLLDYGEQYKSPVPPEKLWLVPIWKKAGAKYKVPWQLLAAVNGARSNFGYTDCETKTTGNGFFRIYPGAWRMFGGDYGGATDQPGAECWTTNKPVKFTPDHTSTYFDAVDATFAEARLLAHAGADKAFGGPTPPNAEPEHARPIAGLAPGNRLPRSDMVPLTGEGANGQAVHPSIKAPAEALIKKYHMLVVAGWAAGGHAPNSDHYWGGALDLVPDPAHGGSWDLIDKLAKWAEPSQNHPAHGFRWVGYTGDPGHGRGNHLHLSFGPGGIDLAGISTAPAWPRFDTKAKVDECSAELFTDGPVFVSPTTCGEDSGQAGGPAGPGVTVAYSVYGGPGDPTTHGDGGAVGHLSGTTGFAELGCDPNNCAWNDANNLGKIFGLPGPLKAKQQVLITINGKKVVGVKLDVGAGFTRVSGRKISGHESALDLWWETANKLGVYQGGNGSGLAKVQLIGGDASKAKGGSGGDVGATAPGGADGGPAEKKPPVAAAAARFNVPFWILWGVFGAESTWGTGGTHPFGLVSPQLHETGDYKKDALIAAKLLALLKQQEGTWEKALRKYSNNGYGVDHLKQLAGGAQVPSGASTGLAAIPGASAVGALSPADQARREAAQTHCLKAGQETVKFPKPYTGAPQRDPVSKVVAYNGPGSRPNSPCYVAAVHAWYTAIAANPPDQQSAIPGLGGPASDLRKNIVRIAQEEVGTKEQPPGCNCGPPAHKYSFPAGQYWCAYFATWVWRKAGVQIQHSGFSGFPYTWGRPKGLVKRPTDKPVPGDFVLYGSGPASTGTSVHIGIVEKVLPGGKITTIEGNYSDQVGRRPPFDPRHPPEPIYAFVAPDHSSGSDTGANGDTTGAAKPKIESHFIPYPQRRKDEMAAYSQRHYHDHSWQLTDPKVIIWHYTAGPSAQSAYDTFAPDHPDPTYHETPNVCAHFVIDKDGSIWQLVHLGVRCRHAVGMNYTAIGIEMAGNSDHDILGNPAMLKSALQLTKWLQGQYNIATSNVIGHDEVGDSRYFKDDAGLHNDHVDWLHADMVRIRQRIGSADTSTPSGPGSNAHEPGGGGNLPAVNRPNHGT